MGKVWGDVVVSPSQSPTRPVKRQAASVPDEWKFHIARFQVAPGHGVWASGGFETRFLLRGWGRCMCLGRSNLGNSFSIRGVANSESRQGGETAHVSHEDHRGRPVEDISHHECRGWGRWKAGSEVSAATSKSSAINHAQASVSSAPLNRVSPDSLKARQVTPL